MLVACNFVLIDVDMINDDIDEVMYELNVAC